MTPLILGKRHVKHLSEMFSKLPRPDNINTNVAGVLRYHYKVMRIAHLIGPKLIKFMGIRSTYTVGVEIVEDNTDSHKHNDSGTNRDAVYIVNIGANPFTLLYTDPRNNTEYLHIVEVGSSFILSTTHTYCVINNHNHTPAIMFTINAHVDFDTTVRRFQHQW